MKWRIAIINILAVVLMLSLTGIAKADLLGVDVSRWQGEINWNELRYHASFAIVKAGGADNGFYVDSQFYRNRDELRRMGMLRGYYYYAGGGNPVAEAQHFASIVAPLEPGEVVVMDFEANHPNPAGYSLQFMKTTEELLGVKPIFYTYMNRVRGCDWSPVVNNGNPFWGAIYDGDPLANPGSGSWPSLTMKQFTSSAVLPGINDNTVDMNYFPGNGDDFIALGKQAPPPVPVPEPEPAHTGFEGIKANSPEELEKTSVDGSDGSLFRIKPVSTPEDDENTDTSTDETGGAGGGEDVGGAAGGGGEDGSTATESPAGDEVQNPSSEEIAQVDNAEAQQVTEKAGTGWLDNPMMMEETSESTDEDAALKTPFESFVRDVMYPFSKVIM